MNTVFPEVVVSEDARQVGSHHYAGKEIGRASCRERVSSVV